MASFEPVGLLAQGRPVPLRGVRIEARVRGVAAEVTVTQRYANTETVPVEAVYSFPLPEAAAVSDFAVEIGGNRIVGRIEEREKAFEEYDEAMARGYGAFLLDQERPNIFVASVGNLLPGQEAAIRLGYVIELEQAGGRIRFLIPTTVSPRYIPPEHLGDMDPAELDRISPPVARGGLPYGLELAVEIEAGAEIREIACPSHPVRIALAGRTARVELAGEGVPLDQDFVLAIALADPRRAAALVARDEDGSRVVLLHLEPDLGSLKRVPAEVVFILDRSGSMGGESIAQARRALLLGLRSLEEGDRFNVVGFGTTCQCLFPESRPYGEETLEEATRYVEGLDANLGGTELLAPLKAVLAPPPRPGLPRRVLLLTDGQVGNEAECFDLAARFAGHGRVFTLGIGRGVSEHLVRGLARASRGRSELIHPDERIEPRVLRQLARMTKGALDRVRVEWGGLGADLTAPAELPPIYPGDGIMVYGRLTGGVPGEAAIVADGPDGQVRFPVFVDTERARPDRSLPALMARAAIRELEEGRGAAGGSAQRGRKERRVREQILELALRYRLVSSATSLVAVEERAEGVQARLAELRRIPVMLTRGWGGLGGGHIRAQVSFCTSCPAEAKTPGAVLMKDEASPRRKAGNEPVDDLVKLALAQHADGGFKLGRELAAVVGGEPADLEAAAAELAAPRKLAQRVVATLAALRALAARFGDRRQEWTMLAEKAERWLERQGVPAPAGWPDLREWWEAVAVRGGGGRRG